MPQLIPLAIMALAHYGYYYAAAALVAASIVVANDAARAARNKARDDFNASLKDRLVMTATTDGPRSRIYGRARNVDGVLFKGTHGDKSQYYTLVIALAGHEVDAIEEVYFNDEIVTLDSAGYVTSAPYAKPTTTNDASTATLDNTGNGNATISLGSASYGAASAFIYENESSAPVTAILTGSTLTLQGTDPSMQGKLVYISYQTAATQSKARITKYRGTDAQDLSAGLAANFPDLITSAHRFAGIACLLVELEFDQDVFPGGLPTITAVVRGAKVYDPRDGVTRWTQNPALIARDWALYSAGGGATSTELHSVSSVANACDVSHDFVSIKALAISVTSTRPMYQCNLVANLSAAPDQTLNAIVQSMAGRWAWDAGKLRIKAGAWTAPVATLTEDWCSGAGDIEIIAGVSRADLVNIYSPSIADAAQGYIITPTAAVRATAYIAADGMEMPTDISLAGVTDTDHAQHVCGVMMRDARQGLSVRIPCNLRAYPVEVFDTIAVTLPRFGWSAKAFTVLAWEFSQTGGVILTLKETDASIYDPDASFVTLDAAANTALPDPFNVPAIAGLALDSGTNQLLKQADGTITSRIRASWTAVADEAVRNSGAIEILYGPAGTAEAALQRLEVAGTATSAYLGAVRDGAAYIVTARARNALVRGAWCPQINHQVIGKTAAPANVAALAATPVNGDVSINWTQNTEADYDRTELRRGASWAAGTPIGATSGSSFFWSYPGAATYTVWAKHFDSSGNASTAVSNTAVVTAPTLSGLDSTAAAAVATLLGDYLIINPAGHDVDAELRWNRTTGGSASITWNGALLQASKPFIASQMGINNISATEPAAPFAKQIWLHII